MNDFTKEELCIIRNLINNLDEKMLTWSESVILVQSKIQFMIDNYCEHESLKSYVESERKRIASLATIEEYDRLKKELSQEDARFQFGKQCGYFSAICAVDNKMKEIESI